MAGLVISAPPRTCPLCDGADHTVVGTHDRNGNELRTVMCRTCGHVFTNPPPTAEDLTVYYSKTYRREYKGVITPKHKHVLRAGLRAIERLQRLSRWCAPPSTVLDIGAGGGEFAYLLRSAGFQIIGIEPNEGYAGFAKTSYDLDIRAATLETSEFPVAQFDAITIHHVLEHLSEPRLCLEKLKGWLKPNGILVIEVPNVMSWFHAPRRRFHAAHLHSFHMSGLEDLLLAAGFVIESAMTTPGPQHLNVVARNAAPPQKAANIRNAAPDISAHFAQHTELTHILSGMALTRLWGNAKRPWREWWQWRALGSATEARGILDGLYRPHLSS